MVTKEQVTPEQWDALTRLFERQKTESKTPAATLEAFAATAQLDTLADCVMVPVFGFWIGIEKDGYAHS